MNSKQNSSENSPDSDWQPNHEQMARFVELYSQHCAKLQYFLMALVPTSHDAVDVLQETSLVLWKKFDSFEPGTNFMAWACKIARIQALKHHQNKRRSAKSLNSTVLEKLAVDAENVAQSHTIPLEILERCVGKLSEIDQKLIRRRYEPGSSVSRIADDIGRSANSVSKSLGRIRRSLLQCMEHQLSQHQ